MTYGANEHEGLGLGCVVRDEGPVGTAGVVTNRLDSTTNTGLVGENNVVAAFSGHARYNSLAHTSLGALMQLLGSNLS